MLGLLTVERRPDLFEKVLFRGMCTDCPESEKRSIEFVLERMRLFNCSESQRNRVSSLGTFQLYKHP